MIPVTAPDTFPDRGALEQIRRDLWMGREHGRASVMVGAGFSRNARPASGTSRPFPTWHDLGQALQRDLDPHAHATSSPPSPGDVMRLAMEYEVHFGASRLADLVRREIPDEDYEPGPMHQRLLSLPWADVFSTNYDTLLERTRRLVPERHYELVLVPADIPGRVQPRIISVAPDIAVRHRWGAKRERSHT